MPTPIIYQHRDMNQVASRCRVHILHVRAGISLDSALPWPFGNHAHPPRLRHKETLGIKQSILSNSTLVMMNNTAVLALVVRLIILANGGSVFVVSDSGNFPDYHLPAPGGSILDACATRYGKTCSALFPTAVESFCKGIPCSGAFPSPFGSPW